MDQAFLVGERIKLESEEIGTVLAIGLRSTKIKSLSNEVITVPNGVLANMKIINFARPSKQLRVDIKVSIAYGSNPAKVKKALLDSAAKTKLVLKNPKPFVRFKELGEYSIKFRLFVFIKDFNDMYEVKDQLITKVYKELNKRKILIPFPTRTLHLKP